MKTYESTKMDVMKFVNTDILTNSPDDEDEGEFDPNDP